MKARILSTILLLTLCAVGAQAKPPKKKHPAVKPAPATAPADKAEVAAPPEGPAAGPAEIVAVKPVAQEHRIVVAENERARYGRS